MKKSIVNSPPGHALKFGLRLPIWLYRGGLGWLMGERFLMITHVGRISGLARRSVVEVDFHDKSTDTYYVISGWGVISDWYQNIAKTPAVMISVGKRKFQSTAQFISKEKAGEILEIYAKEHPTAFKGLCKLFLGDKVENTFDAIQFLIDKMPMVSFSPGA